jgi:hypothetical protein
VEREFGEDAISCPGRHCFARLITDPTHFKASIYERSAGSQIRPLGGNRPRRMVSGARPGGRLGERRVAILRHDDIQGKFETEIRQSPLTRSVANPSH